MFYCRTKFRRDCFIFAKKELKLKKELLKEQGQMER